MINEAREYAFRCHSSTNHYYDKTLPYSHHLRMVVEVAKKFIHLIPEKYRDIVIAACYCHDVIEDTRQTFNDVRIATCLEVAEIVYALTNEKGRTRRERANEKYYEGIRNTRFATFCKLCDRIANIEYSISKGSDALSMYSKENPHFIRSIYTEEYDEMFDYLKEIVS